jgi:hypothetical protein
MKSYSVIDAFMQYFIAKIVEFATVAGGVKIVLVL